MVSRDCLSGGIPFYPTFAPMLTTRHASSVFCLRDIGTRRWTHESSRGGGKNGQGLHTMSLHSFLYPMIQDHERIRVLPPSKDGLELPERSSASITGRQTLTFFHRLCLSIHLSRSPQTHMPPDDIRLLMTVSGSLIAVSFAHAIRTTICADDHLLLPLHSHSPLHLTLCQSVSPFFSPVLIT